MLCFKASIILILLGMARSQQVANDERPFLRILAPKFICNEKKAEQSSNLTIGLQTRDGQSLRYRITIDFELLDGFKSQQHTLSIWKNIRLLQKKFANISDEISLKNQIEIAAQELTSQVKYTFRIVGSDSEGRSSDEQNFTITYKGSELKALHDNLGDGVSLLLFSSEFFYDDMEILAVAEVSFCDPINDFSYRWSIAGETITGIAGNALKLPVGTYSTGQFFELVVTVLNNESLTLATATLPVKIISKEFQLQNAPSECLVGTNREILFSALTFRQPRTANLVKWKCVQDGNDCSGNFVNYSTVMTQLMTFSAAGNFELTSEVSFKDVVKSSTSKITVDPKVIPHVQIKYFPSQPINVLQPNEIVVTVMNLIPKCFAFWNLLSDDDGFAGFKEGADGNLTNMGLTVITDFEEHFLNELVDYDNNTLSKDVSLQLPADVMMPDVNYKFQLTVTCPEPLTDSVTQGQRENLTSFYNIVVSTNSPPETLPLIIQPSNGFPMRQIFKFSTGAAKDSSADFPLKYSFGYIVNNISVTIGTFYENTVAHTQLPFSNQIETFLESCDNNNACVKTPGPTVSANLDHKYSSEEIEFKLAEFDANLRRGEYSKSVNAAVVFLLTMQTVAGDTVAYEIEMLAMIKQELEKLKSSNESGVIYQQRIVEFVKMSKKLSSLMPIADEAFINELLTLTESINRSSKRVKRLMVTKHIASNVMSHDTDYINSVLGFSELLLDSNNASVVQMEKRKFVEKIHQFVASLCQDKNLNSHIVKSKFAIFEISKVFSPQLFTYSQTMPGGTASVMFQNDLNMPIKYVCVGKIKFTIDTFKSTSETTTREIVYEMMLLNDDGSGTYKPIKSNEIADSMTAKMSISADKSSDTCFIWKDDDWNSDLCTKVKSDSTDQVTCKCKTNKGDGIVIKTGKTTATSTASSETTVYNPTITTAYQTPETASTTPFTFLSTRSTMKFEDVSSSVAATIITAPVTTETLTHSQAFSESEQIRSSSSSMTTSAVTIGNSVTNAPTKSSDSSTVPSSLGTITTYFPSSTTSIKTSAQTSLTTLSALSNATNSHTTILSTKTTELVKLSTKSGATTFSPLATTFSTSNTSSESIVQSNDASISITLIILLLVFFALIVILFAIHKCRKYAESHTNLPMRSSSNAIKYAKYHDEFTMQM